MTADTVSPIKKNLQPLKKRRVEIKDEHHDNEKNDDQSLQEIDRNKECIKEENKETAEQKIDKEDAINEKNNSEEHSEAKNSEATETSVPELETNEKTSSTAENEKENENESESNNEKLVNNTQSSFISIRKVEELLSTPKKNIESNNSVDTTNIKLENTTSPHVFNSSAAFANSTWSYRSVKSLTETPTPKKNKHYLEESTTPVLRKRRKISNDISDCDRLSDVLKSELYDTSLNDMEPIAMLHDLDSVMDFEDTKITTEFLSSTAISPGQDDHNGELHKDPQTDPLFIENNDEIARSSEEDEEEDEDSELDDAPEAISNSKENKQKRSIGRNCRKNINRKSESYTKNNDKTYNYIQNMLGALDIRTEAEKLLSEEAEKQLYNLEVNLIHKVPLQHKVERSAGSKSLTETERQLFVQYGPIKKGVFSPDEDKVITNNWKTFCNNHNWDPRNTDPFINLKNGDKFYIRRPEERQKFVQFLANGLPWRTLFSVYQRFKKLYEKTKKRHFKRYTSAEDEQILSYLRKKHGNSRTKHTSFVELSKVLNRSNHSIWLRYQLLKKMQKNQNGQPLTRVKWTLTLIGKFIRTLMDVALCEKIEDLKDATIPKPVWMQLQTKLNIDHDVLKLFWMHQLHMQLFCQESIYMNDIKIKLIEYIYGKGIAHTREIIWPNVARYFEGATSVFLCKVFFYLVQEAMIKTNSKNLIDIIEHLHHQKINDIRNEPTDKFLPRLSYADGKVKIVDEDVNELI